MAKKKKINVVYSTNPDFNFDYDEDENEDIEETFTTFDNLCLLAHLSNQLTTRKDCLSKRGSISWSLCVRKKLHFFQLIIFVIGPKLRGKVHEQFRVHHEIYIQFDQRALFQRELLLESH